MTDEATEAMNDEIRMKVLYSFLGSIEGIHTNLDHVRDRDKMVIGHPSDSDYNIEMAQQSLEVVSFRLQQAAHIIGDRMPKPKAPSEPIRSTCTLCHDGVVWHPGNGGQWLGDTPPRDWANCYGSVDGPNHEAPYPCDDYCAPVTCLTVKGRISDPCYQCRTRLDSKGLL